MILDQAWVYNGIYKVGHKDLDTHAEPKEKGIWP